MGSTLEMLVVGTAVAAALIWAARAGWMSVKTKGGCSSCGSAGECPFVGDPEALAELSKKGQLTNLDSCQPGTISCQELAESLEKETSSKTP
jgi:hypothetical protein